MGFFRHLKLHLIGHHSGSAHAMEMAAIYPDEIFTVALSGPALMSEEEQAVSFKAIGGEWSKVCCRQSFILWTRSQKTSLRVPEKKHLEILITFQSTPI
jgi:alpha-beta hydrolase superfamily lysophospholipase